MKKGNIFLIIIITLAIVCPAGYFGYQYYQQSLLRDELPENMKSLNGHTLVTYKRTRNGCVAFYSDFIPDVYN